MDEKEKSLINTCNFINVRPIMAEMVHLQKLAELILLLGGKVDYVARIIKDEEYHIMLLQNSFLV